MDVDPKDTGKLLLSLVVAVALSVAIALAASRWSGGGAQAAAMAGGPPATYVELRLGGGPPEVYRLRGEPTVREVLAAAGVPVPPGLDGERPCRSGEAIAIAADGTVSTGLMAGARMLTLGLRVPLNEAAAADLAAIPGVSGNVASRIAAERVVRGPFRTWEQVGAVEGVGEHVVQGLKRYASL